MPAVYVLFGALLTVTTSLALGKLLLRQLGIRLYRQEEHVFAFVTGAVCLSAITFLLCALGAARKGVFLGVGLVALAIAVWRGMHRPVGEPLPPLRGFWKWLFGVPFAVFAVLYFFNAMAPEFSPDGSGYHLGLVARHLRTRGFARLTTNMYANLSQGVELLYLYAFAWGRHSAAALVHFAFLVTLPLAMLAYARRFGFAPAGVCGAILVFAAPVVGIDGTTAYNDVALACVLFTLFYLLQIWAAEPSPALLVPIGLLAGFCYAAKYTAFLAVAYALLFIGWKLLRRRQPMWRPLLLVSTCALVMIVPWMAKNWIILRNPLSPFFNAWFPNPYVHVSFEKEYARNLRHYDGLNSYAEIPLEVTVRGSVLGGLLGPVFLLAPVGLGAVAWPAGRQLLLAAAIFGAPYAANIGTRFLIPPAPFLALAMGLVLARLPGAVPVVVLVHTLASWPSVLTRYCAPTAWRLTGIPWRAALRLQSEEDFLNSKTTLYGVARMIERLAPPGSRVLSLDQIPEAYTSRDVIVGYQSAFGNVAREMLYTPLMSDVVPAGRVRFRFPPQALRAIRVVQTASGGPDHWSIAELRLFHGERELDRAPDWRLRAHPNPWGVQRAFDASPLTRWRSWQELFPGMFVAVDLGRREIVDSVLLECSRDQYKVALKLEGRDESGAWKLLSDAPEQWEGTLELGLRRGAVEELKALGITHLLLFDHDFGADDFRTKGAVWGVTQLGEWYGARLYRLD